MVLTKEYIIEILASYFKNKQRLTPKQQTLIAYFNEFFIGDVNIFKYFHGDIEYLILFEYIIKNFYEDDIILKENAINQFNDIDEYTLIDIKNSLNRIFSGECKLSQHEIDVEIDKIIKYIFLQEAKESLEELEKKFHSLPEEVVNEYEKYVSKLFMQYEKTIDFKAYIFGDDENELDKILEGIAESEGEIKEVSFIPVGSFIQAKRVAIFTAGTGVGKSHALAACAADYLKHAENKNGKKNIILLITAENNGEETSLRIAANLTSIHTSKLKKLLKTLEGKKQIKDLIKTHKKKNNELVIVEIEANIHTAKSIEAIVDFYLKKYKDSEVYAIIIDYLDKLRSVRKSNDLRTELGYITDELKNIAKKYNTPIITATQTNRTGRKQAEKGNLELENIGESWKKAENADIVIGIEPISRISLDEKIVKFKFLKHRYDRDGYIVTLQLNVAKSQFILLDTNQEIQSRTSTGNIDDDIQDIDEIVSTEFNEKQDEEEQKKEFNESEKPSEQIENIKNNKEKNKENNEIQDTIKDNKKPSKDDLFEIDTLDLDELTEIDFDDID